MNSSDEKPAKDKRAVREFWRETLDDNLEVVRERLLEATAATRSVWVTCSNCKHRSEVEVADIRARTDAVNALHTLAGERPKPASDEGGGGGFVLKRVVVMPDGAEYELPPGAEPLPRAADSDARAVPGGGSQPTRSRASVGSRPLGRER